MGTREKSVLKHGGKFGLPTLTCQLAGFSPKQR
jgi:hypothetical protein